MKIDPSLMDGGPERGGNRSRDEGRRPQRNFDSPGRGRTASGSRYSNNTNRDSAKTFEKKDSNRATYDNSSDRRGFLKKRSSTDSLHKTISEHSFASNPEKKLNDNFYKESFFNSSDYKKSEHRNDSGKDTRHKATGSSDFRKNNGSFSKNSPYKKHEGYKPFASEPFMNNEEVKGNSRDLAPGERNGYKSEGSGQKKPFTPYGKFRPGAKSKHSSFAKYNKKTFVKASR